MEIYFANSKRILKKENNTLVNISATVSAQPNCSVSTGTITASSTTTGVTFSIDGSIYMNTTGIFTGMRPGTYSVTAKNSSNEISAAVSVTVMLQPSADEVLPPLVLR